MIIRATNGRIEVLDAPKVCSKCKKTTFNKDQWDNKDVFVCCGCGMVYDPVVLDFSDLLNNDEVRADLAKQIYSVFGLPERYFRGSFDVTEFNNPVRRKIRY